MMATVLLERKQGVRGMILDDNNVSRVWSKSSTDFVVKGLLWACGVEVYRPTELYAAFSAVSRRNGKCKHL